MVTQLSKTTIILAIQEQVSSELDEESVILNLRSGIYYGLNAVGTRIWHLIQSPKTIEELQKTLASEYEVAPEQCERDLAEIFQKLNAAGLIEVRDAAIA
jgi:Coenzyme PQQ synthesis protein D (PqqD)